MRKKKKSPYLTAKCTRTTAHLFKKRSTRQTTSPRCSSSCAKKEPKDLNMSKSSQENLSKSCSSKRQRPLQKDSKLSEHLLRQNTSTMVFGCRFTKQTER